jgi:hypothetical protein
MVATKGTGWMISGVLLVGQTFMIMASITFTPAPKEKDGGWDSRCGGVIGFREVQ